MLPSKPVSNNQEILEIFMQVKINIPLLDAIKQILLYAKFLKDLCTVKQKLKVQKKKFLILQACNIPSFINGPKPDHLTQLELT